MPYKKITPPAGEKIARGRRLEVPDRPILAFSRRDGTGPDIWAASERFQCGRRERIRREEEDRVVRSFFAGQAAKDRFDEWLPDDTVDGFASISSASKVR